MTTGVPIYYAFYRALQRMGDGTGKKYVGFLADSGFYRMIQQGARQRTSVSTCARVSFWKAFGVSPSVQIAIEERFSHMELDTRITEDPEGKYAQYLPY